MDLEEMLSSALIELASQFEEEARVYQTGLKELEKMQQELLNMFRISQQNHQVLKSELHYLKNTLAKFAGNP